ncbi:hypothetical protein MVEN_01566400 [Mycena venus]|uniref:Uncharacterized protein n=1 Tax=Mycena venus TaxID=2733690 RepID=A0A8H6XPC4_9AGAR|nr:hypothetical protein MVEN_01566400 [Mycena venus]
MIRHIKLASPQRREPFLTPWPPPGPITTEEYDPYQDAHAPSVPHTNPTLLSPNRPKQPHEKSSWDTQTVAHSPEEQSTTLIWTIILTGVVIVLAVGIVALGVLVQIFRLHVYHITDGAVYTTAPLGRTLAIVHLSSLVVALSVPIAVGLGAYSLAGRWLAASRVEGPDRPTPYQLGILMKTLNGANLGALWAGSTYIVGRGVTPGGKSLSRPPMLRHAVFMLFFFLFLAYATTLTETWLGAVSVAVPYPVTDINQDGPFPSFGRRVNQTLCDETKDAANNRPYQCGLVHGSGGNPPAQSQQILTMNGLSKTTVIAFTDDSTAIMVPPTANLSDQLGWVSTTLGVKSTCTSVTAQCIDPTHFSSNAGLDTNCPPSVNFNTTTLFSDICNPYQATMYGGPLGPDGVPLACLQNTNSTEFRFGAEIISQAYNVNNSGEIFVGDTGFYLHGNRGGYNLLTCDMKSLEVKYHYFNGSYTLLSSTPSDLAQAQRLSDGSWAALYYVPTAVDGAGLYSGSYVDAFAQKLSLVTLSTTAYVIEPAEALQQEYTWPFLGSRIPLAPFLLLFTLAFIYCVSVATITSLAVVEIRKSPYTAVARSRLLDPATVISTAYGPEDSKLKPTHTIEELFGEETAADRLNVAVDTPVEGLPIVRRSTFQYET